MLARVFALARHFRTHMRFVGKSRYLSYGTDVHVGAGLLLWAPDKIRIGSHINIGKHVNIEANCEIGDYCLIANCVAIVGRHDHDFTAIGFPVRYSPWVGSRRYPSPFVKEKAVIEKDVWLGYGVIVLTGVTVGRGSIVAAGSVVTKDIPAYSIAAGVPARVVGIRFSDPSVIALHEAAIRDGRFKLSERSYDNCVIEPALKMDGGAK